MKASKAGGYVSVGLLMASILFAYMSLQLTTTTATARMHGREMATHMPVKQDCEPIFSYHCD